MIPKWCTVILFIMIVPNIDSLIATLQTSTKSKFRKAATKGAVIFIDGKYVSRMITKIYKALFIKSV